MIYLDIEPTDYTRVELIDLNTRTVRYLSGNERLHMSVQDEGRTLKLFVVNVDKDD